MSTYLRMWARIKQLSPEEVRTWVMQVSACKGKIVDFYGVHIMDFELYDALITVHNFSRRPGEI